MRPRFGRGLAEATVYEDVNEAHSEIRHQLAQFLRRLPCRRDDLDNEYPKRVDRMASIGWVKVDDKTRMVSLTKRGREFLAREADYQ